MNSKTMKNQINEWMAKEEMPKGFLKPINKYDDLYPQDEDEYQAYMEYRSWYLNKDHQVLLSIPVKHENKIPVETDDSISFAYQSIDFKRDYPFNNYQYKMGKIKERIVDLATTFSSISHQEGKRNTLKKFQALVDKEFRNKAVELVKTYNKHKVWINRERLFERIQDLNNKILACKRIWSKYAFIE